MIRASLALAALLATSACAVLAPPCEDGSGPPPLASHSAACAVVADGRLLVIRHLYSGRLDLPGGRSKRGETASCTAQRETWEETGLRVVVREPLPDLGSIYLCELADPAAIESAPPLRWWSRGEVAELRWVDPQTLTAEHWRYGERVVLLKQALSRSAPAQRPGAEH